MKKLILAAVIFLAGASTTILFLIALSAPLDNENHVPARGECNRMMT